MAKRMLIDAAHPEETRVVVLNGNRLEEFDFETSTKKQIKGNIYLAKVTRVEPSLQAAFVEYGGNRHGFLAFNEIHPDYYRIPIADRQAALDAERAAEQAANAREEARERHGGPAHVHHDEGHHDESHHDESHHDEPHEVPDEEPDEEPQHGEDRTAEEDDDAAEQRDPMALAAPPETRHADEPPYDAPEASFGSASGENGAADPGEAADDAQGTEAHAHEDESSAEHGYGEGGNGSGTGALSSVAQLVEAHGEHIETVGGDELEEATRPRARPFRHYKIQEVIKRRQIMLVQVVKEERGNKGAALTTYLSLAGRYCVLMPNTPRGGGVSRKITSATDRRRLKDLMSDLEMPEGMGVIVRTAGSERSKPEIKRDFEYLLRLWDEIRDLTLKSTAPALIYEEGNLIKRSIRDLYARDIEEVVVDGDEGYRTAKDFMKMLMPSHAKRVKPYRDPSVPLFYRYQIEQQIDAIHSPTVQLRSGGYIVINPTEALVAIDVNSGRSTKERNIEETALKTNIEAAEEVARQLRLRDLAGLIVIDYIDMEEYRNRATVERRLKDAMRFDRARIQLGRISPFGLLELSRQRLRPSLVEASTQPCPFCNGSGHIRSIESTALHVLRAIEEEGMRRRSAEIAVTVPSKVALYILNQKRRTLQQIEARFGILVVIGSDDTLVPPAFRLERTRALTPAEIAALPLFVPSPPEIEEEDEDDDIALDDEDVEAAQDEEREEEPDEAAAEEAPMSSRPAEEEPQGQGERDGERRGEHSGRPRRRRRRGRRDEGHSAEPQQRQPLAADAQAGDEPEAGEPAPTEGLPDHPPQEGTRAETASEAEHRRRRRGRRGGRKRRREGPPGADRAAAHQGAEPTRHAAYEEDVGGLAGDDAPEAETIELVPAPSGQDEGVHDVAEAFNAPASPSEMLHDIAAVPVADGDHAPAEEPSSRSTSPEPAPPASPYNVPPPREVTGPPPNPKRGWWRRG